MHENINNSSNQWFRIPGTDSLEKLIHNMSRFEKGLLYIFGALLLITTIGLVAEVNARISTTVPARGGTLTEGVVGYPRFVNPLLAISSADRNITQLVYSGLLSATSEGTLKLDLAKNYTISDNGLRYTFTIRDDATFHDGTPITADDVIFTVKKAQNNAIRSPKQGNWDGVAIEKIEKRTVQFILSEPYSPFLENATLGIMPKHIWEGVDAQQFQHSQYNTRPVGSGPYRVRSVKRDSSGMPEYYVLTPFEDYAREKPYIEKIIFRFYSNEDALISAFKEGDIQAVNSISSEHAQELSGADTRIETFPLPRIFGVFFNQNNASIFTEKAVREALNTAVDKQKIVQEVLHNYGTPINGPIPPGTARMGVQVASLSQEAADQSATSTQARLTRAREILENAGWTLNENGVYEKNGTPLSFTISTSNAAELKKTAQYVEAMWEDLGAEVKLEFFEIGNLKQDIIRPREYDALLFGQIIGRDLDFFAFWHSSQRTDPGLNIAMYTSITADNLLEEMRSTANPADRVPLYNRFEKEIQASIPAVFLYAPDFIYALPEKVSGVDLGIITTPAERFLDVHTWYIDTQSVWTMFSDEEVESGT